MGYNDADLDSWFWEFIGLGPSGRYKARYKQMNPSQQRAFRKRKAARTYSKEDRRTLSKKRYVHAQVVKGVGLYMNRRRQKGLGTYDVNSHVVAQWDPAHRRNKFSEIFARNRSELDEISSVQEKLPRARDKRGRFI